MTETEWNAAMMGVQNALFMRNILKSLGPKVKLPMLASIDNGGAGDIGVGRRTCHMELKENFLWKLNEAGVIEFQWVYMANNESDMFQKLVMLAHNKHAAMLCRHNK